MDRRFSPSLLMVLLLTTTATAIAPHAPPGPAADDLPAPLPAALPVVPGLNSDFLDGMSEEDFAAAQHDHDERYLAIDGKAADSHALDGLDSSDFALAGHAHKPSASGWSAESTGFVAASSGWMEIPGLSLTIDLTQPALVHVSAQGAQRFVDTPVNHELCNVGYRFVVDGSPRGDPGWGESLHQNLAGQPWEGWSLTRSVRLPVGTHTLSVQANPFSCNVCAEWTGASEAYARCALNVAAFYA